MTQTLIMILASIGVLGFLVLLPRIQEVMRKKKEEARARSAQERAERTLDELPPVDGSILQVWSLGELQVGTVIRIRKYGAGSGGWITGWWSDVIQIDSDGVHMKDLVSGKVLIRSIGQINEYDIPGKGIFRHRDPAHVRAISSKKALREGASFANLRAECEGLDLSAAPESQLVSRLRRELEWQQSHQNRFHDLQEEFEVHEEIVRKIGKELDSRGGEALMLKTHQLVQGGRHLERQWDGIGNWRG